MATGLLLKHPIEYPIIEVHRPVQAGAESVNESHGADVQRSLVLLHPAGAVGLLALCDDPQEDGQHPIQYRPAPLLKMP